MTKPLKIRNRLDLQLAALFDAPEGPGPHPLVIVLHGNTGWKEEPHLVTLAEGLATAGIAALRFDTSGSGKSEGNWAEHYRVSNYITDVSDVYEYALQNLPVDPVRIGLWGHSMGGLVAICAAAGGPGRFKAVCGCEPSSGSMSAARDSSDAARDWEKSGWLTLPTEIFGDIKLPYDYYMDRGRHQTAPALAKLQSPLLLIAGTSDKVVSAASVKALFEAAIEPKQYLEFPMGHDYKNDPDMMRRVNGPIFEFFTRILAP